MGKVINIIQVGRRYTLLPYFLIVVTNVLFAQKIDWQKMNVCPWDGKEIRSELEEYLGDELPYAVWVFVVPDPIGGKLTYMPQLRGTIKDILSTRRVHEKFVFIIDNRKRIPRRYADSVLPFLLGRYYDLISDQVAGIIWDTTGYLIKKYTLNIEEGLVFAILMYGNEVLFCNEVKWRFLTNLAESLGSNAFDVRLEKEVQIPCNDSITDLCTYYNPNLVVDNKALFYNYDPSCLQWFDLKTGKWKKGRCIDDIEAVRLFCKFFAPSSEHCLSALKYFKVMRDVGRGSIVLGSFDIDSGGNIWAGGSAELFIPVELVKETMQGTDLGGYKKPEHSYTSYVFSLVMVFDSSLNIKRMIPVTADEKTWGSVWYAEAFVDPGTAGIIDDSLYITYWAQDIWFYSRLSPRRLIGTLRIGKVSKFCGFKINQDTFKNCIPLGNPMSKQLSKQLVALYSAPMFARFQNKLLFTPGIGKEIYDVYSGKALVKLAGPSYIEPFPKDRISTLLTDDKVQVNFVIYSLASDSNYLYVLYKYKEKNMSTDSNGYGEKFIEVFDSAFNRVAIFPVKAYEQTLGVCGIKYGLLYPGGRLTAVCYDPKKDTYLLKQWRLMKIRE